LRLLNESIERNRFNRRTLHDWEEADREIVLLRCEPGTATRLREISVLQQLAGTARPVHPIGEITQQFSVSVAYDVPGGNEEKVISRRPNDEPCANRRLRSGHRQALD
jgi:hypothetical protein